MTAPYYADEAVTLHLGESLDVLPTLPDASVDAVVTDPPYSLRELPQPLIVEALTEWLTGDRAFIPAGGRGFMGRDWDRFVPPPAVWDECLRVLKPGGHLVAFAGSRTVDLMGLSMRLAGFELRDSLMWITGSGFPKSLNVAKAIESGGGRPEDIRRMSMGDDYQPSGRGRVNYDHGGGSVMNGRNGPWRPVSEEGKRWEGFGTALKPAHEPIVLARKPLAGTVAATVLAHGTGALNIDGCRTAAGQDYRDKCASVVGLGSNRNVDVYGEWTGACTDSAHDAGRWPTNVILSHPPLLDEHGQPVGDACADGCVPGCPVAEMDAQSGITGSNARANKGERHGALYNNPSGVSGARGHEDSGGASRFFPVFRYEAKATTAERPRLPDGTAWPTVKPLPLMRWLVRLITPPGGTVLDPCAGTSTTLEAAALEGFPSIGIERDRTAAELSRIRLNKPRALAFDFEETA